MKTNSRKLVVYIACSLDGYIAKPNDDLSFLNSVQVQNEDYGYTDFLKSVDCVIMGKRTYDWVMTQVSEFPHKELETYVITSKNIPPIGKINFYRGDLKELILKLKAANGKNIFIDGGAQVVQALLKEKLIDEFIISFIPILLGQGIRLFDSIYPEQSLQLISQKSFSTGLTQIHYSCKI